MGGIIRVRVRVLQDFVGGKCARWDGLRELVLLRTKIGN